jgi:hypothetical protein
MIRRQTAKGVFKGQHFYGCSQYPKFKNILKEKEANKLYEKNHQEQNATTNNYTPGKRNGATVAVYTQSLGLETAENFKKMGTILSTNENYVD